MALFVFYLLMVKHFIGDFALQGRLKAIHDKHLLTSLKGHLHALDHAIGSAFVFLFVSCYFLAQGKTIFLSILIFPLLDYITHFFIDWLKNNFVKANGMQQNERRYWILTGIDQICHASAYFLIVILFSKTSV